MSSINEAAAEHKTKCEELNSTANYLRLLYGDADSGYLTVFNGNNKKTRWFPVDQGLDHAATMIQNFTESFNTFCGVALQDREAAFAQWRAKNPDKQGEPTTRGYSETAVAISGLWVDVDVKDPAHTEQNLPPTKEAAQALVAEFPLPPSLVIDSGHGLYGWWLFRELWTFATDEERQAAERLAKQFLLTLQGIAEKHGWKIDPTADLARLLRAPGTVNRKLESVPVRVIEYNDVRYNPGDFEPYLTQEKPHPGTTHTRSADYPLDTERLKEALEHIPSDPYDDWLLVGMALYSAAPGEEGFTLWDEWSKASPKYKGVEDLRKKWASFSSPEERPAGKSVTLGSLYHRAFQNGWIPGLKDKDVNARGIHKQKFECSDAGNGELFAALYKDMVRYDHPQNQWLLWNEHRWEPDREERIKRYAKEAARLRYRLAADIEDLSKRERASKWAIRSEDAHKMSATLSQARSEAPLADSGKNWDTNKWLLGVPNGVVDLQTGMLRKGERSDRITKSVRISYDAEARCEKWEECLSQWFGGNEELIDWIQRYAGYTHSGDNSDQTCIFCYGTGANGKTIFLRMLSRTLGDYALTTPFTTFEAQRNYVIPLDLADFAGKRLVISSEAKKDFQLNETRIKDIVGGEPQTARHLYAEHFTFNPVCKIWLAGNYKPEVADDSTGFWRKMRLIPFMAKFEGEARDPKLSEKLEQELPGILAWCVRGCLEWQKRGLEPPDIVKAQTAAWRADANEVSRFLSECTVEDEKGKIRCDELYQLFYSWCMHHGYSEKHIPTRNKLGRDLSGRFNKKKTKEAWFYIGLRSLDDEAEAAA
jgi:P4 family phage/plasmid primase-like protien